MKALLLGAAGIVLAAQLVRPSHDAPAPAPGKDIARVLEIPPAVQQSLRHACYDCHSNETSWPWYAHVAPVSWVLARDVESGREALNLSSFADLDPVDQSAGLEAIGDAVGSSRMPLGAYATLHSRAQLTELQRNAIQAWTDRERERLRDRSAASR